jgi:hypothetical protein
MNSDLVTFLYMFSALLMWLISLIARPSVMRNQQAMRLWDRLIWGSLPSPAELEELAGHAVTIVAEARETALTRAHVPVSYGTSVRRVRDLLNEFDALLNDWQLRLLRCDGKPPAEPLPVVRLRLSSLRLVGHVERLAHFMPVDRYRAPMYIHMATLRRALKTTARELKWAASCPPELLPGRLADIQADLALVLRDCVTSHATLWTRFVAWRDTLQRPNVA